MAVTSTENDVVALLKTDHDNVRDLLKRLENAKGNESVEILEQIGAEMHKHSVVEEEIVYPAYKECVGTGDAKIHVEESLAEHENVDKLLVELAELDPESSEFKGRCKFLKESIEHHAKDEEKSMFPEMREKCEKSLLQELGKKVEARKKEIKPPSLTSRKSGGSSGSSN